MIFDTFFLRLLCIAQTEGEYEAVFDFFQGVYAGESRVDFQCVGRARSVSASNVEGACRWEIGWRPVTGG